MSEYRSVVASGGAIVDIADRLRRLHCVDECAGIDAYSKTREVGIGSSKGKIGPAKVVSGKGR